jgi:uncharacterized protein
MTTRREVLQWSASAAANSLLLRPSSADVNLISNRPAKDKRRFVSESVEATIARVKPRISDTRIAWIFENCFPNTLDTTVKYRVANGSPDTFVITGDIDAMWLRDSSAQVWPYLAFAKDDVPLRRMIEGLIRRQAACILIDSYANAFMPDPKSKPLSWAVNDNTDRKPGVGERKWEIDSLCYPIRLAHGYWKKTGDAAPFDATFSRAMKRVVATFREQQRKNSVGPYKFQRKSENATETQFTDGYGNPTRKVGLIHSMFRPSDDACLFPLFIPANLFAVTSLKHLAEMASGVLNDGALAADCSALAQEVSEALHRYGRMNDVWAYEVDGYGNQLFMDDANAPGLLSLPYLSCCNVDDPVYRRTRARVWSEANPYFFAGSAAEGIGGPHEGLAMIWPMSIMMRALTSTSDDEIRQCLTWLKNTDAGTGFMHESFHKDDAKHFTRPWFAWANTLFGELILKLNEERPELLSNA